MEGGAPIIDPTIVLVSFVSQLIVLPIGGNINVGITKFEDGRYKVHLFTDAEFSRPVSWLVSMIRIPILVIFDLCMLRGGTPLRNMRKCHRNAWRDLRTAESKFGSASSFPPSS